MPCHTKGCGFLGLLALAYFFRSVCFLVYEKDETLQFPAVVFTGDTIFLGGCGRFFEGSAADMAKVFNILHAELGQDTLVFTGHEYTLSNLRFAALADPQNSRLIERKKRLEAQALRSPEWEPFATWEEECLTNPFLRCDSEAIKRFTGKSDPIEALAELRKLKNNF